MAFKSGLQFRWTNCKKDEVTLTMNSFDKEVSKGKLAVKFVNPKSGLRKELLYIKQVHAQRKPNVKETRLINLCITEAVSRKQKMRTYSSDEDATYYDISQRNEDGFLYMRIITPRGREFWAHFKMYDNPDNVLKDPNADFIYSSYNSMERDVFISLPIYSFLKPYYEVDSLKISLAALHNFELFWKNPEIKALRRHQSEAITDMMNLCEQTCYKIAKELHCPSMVEVVDPNPKQCLLTEMSVGECLHTGGEPAQLDHYGVSYNLKQEIEKKLKVKKRIGKRRKAKLNDYDLQYDLQRLDLYNLKSHAGPPYREISYGDMP